MTTTKTEDAGYVWLQVDDETYDALAVLAEETGRSINAIAVEAIEKMLREYE